MAQITYNLEFNGFKLRLMLSNVYFEIVSNGLVESHLKERRESLKAK